MAKTAPTPRYSELQRVTVRLRDNSGSFKHQGLGSLAEHEGREGVVLTWSSTGSAITYSESQGFGRPSGVFKYSVLVDGKTIEVPEDCLESS